MFKILADPQLWKYFIHGVLVAFPLRTATFCIAATMLAVPFGGLTQWFWLRFLPEDNTPLAELIGLDTYLGVSPETAEAWLGLVYGAVLLLLLPFITRGLAVADAATSRALLTNETAALHARSEELAASRAQVVSEEASTLRKIERDLVKNPAAARELMDGTFEQSREALAELRQLSRGIAPPLLADRGLRAATESLAARSTVPVVVTGNLEHGHRIAEGAENAAYFVLSEALANISKHSGATSASIMVQTSPGELFIEVLDDGRGGAHLGQGHGLSGLLDRLAGVDGSLEITSPQGGPTALRVNIPL